MRKSEMRISISSSKILLAGGVCLLAIMVFAFVATALSFREKAVSGQVVDCETNEKIMDAKVSLQQRGWGFDGGLVWDKTYVSETLTNGVGEFEATFRVGNNANILVSKDGYVNAQQFEEPAKNISVRMLRGNYPTEVTYNCTLSSECLKKTVEGGVTVFRNSCVDSQ
jgi:hypothetical protein